MITAAVTEGNCVMGVIVCTPLPMLKLITLPGLPFALRIACRNEPGPESLVLVTLRLGPKAVATGAMVNSRIDGVFISCGS